MDKAKRKAIIAGNWKMNKTASEAAVLVDELIPAVKDAACEVVICTPYTGHRCGEDQGHQYPCGRRERPLREVRRLHRRDQR